MPEQVGTAIAHVERSVFAVAALDSSSPVYFGCRETWAISTRIWVLPTFPAIRLVGSSTSQKCVLPHRTAKLKNRAGSDRLIVRRSGKRRPDHDRASRRQHVKSFLLFNFHKFQNQNAQIEATFFAEIFSGNERCFLIPASVSHVFVRLDIDRANLSLRAVECSAAIARRLCHDSLHVNMRFCQTVLFV